MSEERGPSWWDLGDYCDHLAAKYNASVELRLAWPVRRLDGKGKSGWSAVASVSRRRKGQIRPLGRAVRFGAGGAWKTAPAAFHAALRELEAALEAEEAAAAKQTAF